MNKIIQKLSIPFIALGLFTFSATAQIQTPQASPLATVTQAIGLGKATVEYSRPSLKGRKMFGTQLPYGKVWRMGANKVTNLTLSEDMTVGGKKVAAGTYALLAIPTTTEWTIILNKNADMNGAYSYKEAEDVVRFMVKPSKLAKAQEYLTIEFTDFTPTEAFVVMSWENTEVKFAVMHDADAKIMAGIKEKMAGSEVSTDTYMAAASYYYDTDRDLNQAYEWAGKVVEANPKYWTYHLRGKIAAKIGKCDVALADATKGLAMAKAGGDDAYIVGHQQLIKGCEGK